MTSKKRKKYKLLLDEGLPLPVSFPTINDFHDISHIALIKKRGISDQVVYDLANNEGRIPVVLNTKDFKSLIKVDAVSVICLSSNITNKNADLKIHKTLNNLN